MSDTGSSRTAMRWWFCNVLGLGLALGACIGTATEFHPEPGAERLTTFELRDRADDALRRECPRLMGGGSGATGEARLRADVNRQGSVTRATLLHSSGDEQMDRLFGALAARLQFDPLPAEADGTVTRLAIGYSCGAGGQAVSTVRIGAS